MGGGKKGLVFNIVHGSFVDGYGVRTTVFLKGCPLRCVWCCNPEGQSFQAELKYVAGKCTGCGSCVPQCERGALSLHNGTAEINRKLCDGCGRCVEHCYTDALEMFGKWYTPEELFSIVRKDESFYSVSGGGVTIGGGEATAQPEFLMEFLSLCQADHIHTAIDTCGYVTDPLGFECLKKADLLLFDVKGLDESAHRGYTGLSNAVIQKNLNLLSEMRKPMIIRLPIIPGYTDGPDLLKREAELLAKLKSVERVDILPVHEFGKVKYEQLGMEYRLSVQPIPEERQQEIVELFASHGLKTQIGG